MPQSLAALDAITKAIYAPKLVGQLNDEVKTLKRIERSSDGIVTDRVGGKYVTFPVHVRRNSGIGARNELEALPVPGQQGYAAGRQGLKYLYGGAELSGQSIRLAETDYQAFVSAVDEEMKRLKNDLALDLNRQVYGDGTGTIATVTAVGTTSTTVTVGDSSLFNQGDVVDILNAGTPIASGAGLTVNSIPSATTIVVSTAVTTAIGNRITRTGNWNREWTGFSAIVATTGTLHNIDPTVEAAWTANVDSNGGTPRSISEGLMNVMSDTINQRGGETTVIWTTYGIRRAYANLLQQQRQYVNTEGKFDGGYKALAYNTPDGEIPMMVDRMAPKGKVWFINEKEIKLYRENDWDFLTYGGESRWRLKVTAAGTFDAFVTNLYQYSDLGTQRRNTHGLITDVAEN